MKGEESGHVYLVVLLMGGVISLICLVSWYLSLSQRSMTLNYKQILQVKTKVREQLRTFETNLFETFDIESPLISWVGFVPDTLTFSENEGIDYYQLFLQSTTSDAEYSAVLTEGIRVR